MPLVKELRDPEAVAYRKEKAGVEALQQVKARAASDGCRLSQRCRKKSVQERRRSGRVAFTDRTTRICGRNLGSLFTAISDRQVRWVWEADHATALTVPDADAVSEAIERGLNHL